MVTQFHLLVGRNEMAGPMKQFTELYRHDTDVRRREFQGLRDRARLNGRRLRLIGTSKQAMVL